MTTTRSPVQELAKATAETIRFRGWCAGTMADTDAYWQDIPGDSPLQDDPVPEEWFKTCPVCLAGGVAAAALGDPREGDKIWDTTWGGHPEVDALFFEIADRVEPDWDKDPSEEYARPRTPARAGSVVTSFNDTHTEGIVLALLDAIAGQ